MFAYKRTSEDKLNFINDAKKKNKYCKNPCGTIKMVELALVRQSLKNTMNLAFIRIHLFLFFKHSF